MVSISKPLICPTRPEWSSLSLSCQLHLSSHHPHCPHPSHWPPHSLRAADYSASETLHILLVSWKRSSSTPLQPLLSFWISDRIVFSPSSSPWLSLRGRTPATCSHGALRLSFLACTITAVKYLERMQVVYDSSLPLKCKLQEAWGRICVLLLQV